MSFNAKKNILFILSILSLIVLLYSCENKENPEEKQNGLVIEDNTSDEENEGNEQNTTTESILDTEESLFEKKYLDLSKITKLELEKDAYDRDEILTYASDNSIPVCSDSYERIFDCVLDWGNNTIEVPFDFDSLRGMEKIPFKVPVDGEYRFCFQDLKYYTDIKLYGDDYNVTSLENVVDQPLVTLNRGCETTYLFKDFDYYLYVDITADDPEYRSEELLQPDNTLTSTCISSYTFISPYTYDEMYIAYSDSTFYLKIDHNLSESMTFNTGKTCSPISDIGDISQVLQNAFSPVVVNINLQNNEQDVDINKTVSIEFSSNIDTLTTNKYISLTGPNGNEVAIEVKVDDSVVTVTPLSHLNHSTQYQLALSDEIQGINGSNIDQTYQYTFTTQEDDETETNVIVESYSAKELCLLYGLDLYCNEADIISEWDYIDLDSNQQTILTNDSLALDTGTNEVAGLSDRNNIFLKMTPDYLDDQYSDVITHGFRYINNGNLYVGVGIPSVTGAGVPLFGSSDSFTFPFESNYTNELKFTINTFDYDYINNTFNPYKDRYEFGITYNNGSNSVYFSRYENNILKSTETPTYVLNDEWLVFEIPINWFSDSTKQFKIDISGSVDGTKVLEKTTPSNGYYGLYEVSDLYLK